MAKSQTTKVFAFAAWVIMTFSLLLLDMRFEFGKLVWMAMMLGNLAVYLTVYAIIKAIEEPTSL